MANPFPDLDLRQKIDPYNSRESSEALISLNMRINELAISCNPYQEQFNLLKCQQIIDHLTKLFTETMASISDLSVRHFSLAKEGLSISSKIARTFEEPTEADFKFMPPEIAKKFNRYSDEIEKMYASLDSQGLRNSCYSNWPYEGTLLQIDSDEEGGHASFTAGHSTTPVPLDRYTNCMLSRNIACYIGKARIWSEIKQAAEKLQIGSCIKVSCLPNPTPGRPPYSLTPVNCE